MFVVTVQKNIAKLTHQEKMTSGSKSAYDVLFRFSSEWSQLERTAVFRSGSTTIDILLDETNTCTIPWEVLTKSNTHIDIGVYGVKNGKVVLPTVWAKTDDILEGVTTGVEPSEPTPSVYEQLLGRLSSIEEKIDSGGVASPYTYGHGLGVDEDTKTVYVDSVSDFTGDNTLPMTAAGVQSTVGNIELLLKTI